MRVSIAAYGGSNSARSLLDSLGQVPAIDPVRYRHPDMGNVRVVVRNDVVINWGIPSAERFDRCRFSTNLLLNPVEAVNRAANKLQAFHVLQRRNVSIPEFTEQLETARQWIREGTRVYCRTELRGNSGNGIVVARSESELSPCQLYVKGLDVAHEYRFHVVQGQIIDAVRKAWSTEVAEEDRNMDVRNHANGSIFVRSSRSLERALANTAARDTAVNAVQALGLDFGAVDLIETTSGEFKVLEVNTACGLEGTTLTRYTEAFTSLLLNQTVEGLEAPTPEPTGNNQMNLADARQGMSVVFNPTVSHRISTLTVGQTYEIEVVGNRFIKVRNNSGRLAGYKAEYFTVGEQAPATPQVVPEPEGVNTSVTPSDPLRICELADGSQTNPTGTVVFNTSIQQIEEGTEVEVTEVREGEETHDIFIGITYEGNLYFLPIQFFRDGTTSGINLDPSAPAPVITRDVNGRRLNTGNHILLTAAEGRTPSGTLGTITSLQGEEVMVNLESGGTATLPANVVRFLSEQDYQLRIQRRQALTAQENVTITVNGRNYRILSRDLEAVQEVLRRFSL